MIERHREDTSLRIGHEVERRYLMDLHEIHDLHLECVDFTPECTPQFTTVARLCFPTWPSIAIPELSNVGVARMRNSPFGDHIDCIFRPLL